MFLANITAHKAVTNVITADPVLSAAMASANQAKPEHHALLTAEAAIVFGVQVYARLSLLG